MGTVGWSAPHGWSHGATVNGHSGGAPVPWKFPVIVFGVVLAVLAAIGAMNRSSTPPAPARQAVSGPAAAGIASEETSPGVDHSTLDAHGKKYVGEVLGYLKTVNEHDMRMAKTMAGAETGTSSLTDIKEVIERAKFVESLAFGEMYSARPAPPGFEAAVAGVDETHRLHVSAFREYLAYWKDENLAHLVSGNAVMKQAVIQTNASIDENGRAMDLLFKRP